MSSNASSISSRSDIDRKNDEKPIGNVSDEKVYDSDGNELYVVEEIRDKKKHFDPKKRETIWLYHLEWKGYPESEMTWEPKESLDCPELLEAFEKKWNAKDEARKERKIERMRELEAEKKYNNRGKHMAEKRRASLDSDSDRDYPSTSKSDKKSEKKRKRDFDSDTSDDNRAKKSKPGPKSKKNKRSDSDSDDGRKKKPKVRSDSDATNCNKVDISKLENKLSDKELVCANSSQMRKVNLIKSIRQDFIEAMQEPLTQWINEINPEQYYLNNYSQPNMYLKDN